MEIKHFLILSILGVAAGYTIPPQEKSDLESSFSASTSDTDPSSSLSRDKRGLFKKFKKHGGSDTVYVNRQYQGSSGVEYRPNREIHHHHHYSYPAPPPGVVEQPYQPYPAPSNEYHHYHGASGYQQGYANHGSTYYSGGYSGAGSNNYYPRPNYGDGGYAHYGGTGGYVAPPPPQGPVSAVPVATGHNAVDRGQGAAAVNNIAIIHARAGSSSNLVESESKVLPRPLPVNIEDALNMMEE